MYFTWGLSSGTSIYRHYRPYGRGTWCHIGCGQFRSSQLPFLAYLFFIQVESLTCSAFYVIVILTTVGDEIGAWEFADWQDGRRERMFCADDPSLKSALDLMASSRGEMSAKTTYQRSAKGPVAINTCAADGRSMTLENTGRKVGSRVQRYCSSRVGISLSKPPDRL